MTSSVGSSSTARRTTGALCSPVAIRITSRASRIVPTPIVMAVRGTLSSAKKSLAASLIVISSSAMRRVRVVRVEPGSLKPMWPDAADAEDQEVDAAGLLDLVLVRHAVRLHVLGRDVAAGDVDVLLADVDVVEEVLAHEPVVALQAVRRHRVVLVEVERDDVREVEPVVAVEADEAAVDADRRRAGREAEHELLPERAALDGHVGDAARDLRGEVCGRLEDEHRQALALGALADGKRGRGRGVEDVGRHRVGE